MPSESRAERRSGGELASTPGSPKSRKRRSGDSALSRLSRHGANAGAWNAWCLLTTYWQAKGEEFALGLFTMVACFGIIPALSHYYINDFKQCPFFSGQI